ncbi:MAG: hypothetical protein JXR58_08915 [Bacteroidales bacterium]|nr:hypothetical protein [Bacteroidales bacterium]
MEGIYKNIILLFILIGFQGNTQDFNIKMNYGRNIVFWKLSSGSGKLYENKFKTNSSCLLSIEKGIKEKSFFLVSIKLISEKLEFMCSYYDQHSLFLHKINILQYLFGIGYYQKVGINDFYSLNIGMSLHYPKIIKSETTIEDLILVSYTDNIEKDNNVCFSPFLTINRKISDRILVNLEMDFLIRQKIAYKITDSDYLNNTFTLSAGFLIKIY